MFENTAGQELKTLNYIFQIFHYSIYNTTEQQHKITVTFLLAILLSNIRTYEIPVVRHIVEALI